MKSHSKGEKARFVLAVGVLIGLALAGNILVGAVKTSAGRTGKCSEVALDRRPGGIISW